MAKRSYAPAAALLKGGEQQGSRGSGSKLHAVQLQLHVGAGGGVQALR